MKGLVGWVDFRRDLGAQEEFLRAMTDGDPDGHLWVSRSAALGLRRRSPLDVKGGQQSAAIETETGTVVAVNVGGTSNSGELRRALGDLGGPLGKKSDTEMLLEAFLRWGSAFIERLSGAFAFAIWDGRTRSLLLGRDRFGVKPLYYFEYPGGLLFASEPKGIMANPLFKARLAVSGIPILLQPRLTLPGETPLVGLREVPPAHFISYSESGLSRRRYWSLTSAPHQESFDETARTVRALLEDAVSRELASDVPLGAMLSGGVDSTSVAALALKTRRTQEPDSTLDTFCVQFESDLAHFVATELRPEVDAPYAAKAAEFIGSRHQTLTASVQDLMDVLPATRRARDLPGWGQFDASMYLLFQRIRRSCGVALTGEAADEIFGGYPYFFNPDSIHCTHFPWMGTGPKLSDYLSPDVTRQIDPKADERDRYAQLLSEVPRLAGEDPENARMREMLYLGMCGPLSVILDRKDRMSAFQGLDVRIPFCDHRLVEYVWNVPWSMKATGGPKGLLKAAMAGLLPASTVNRKKSAYPHIQNPDYDRGLVREANRLANDPRSPIAGLFDVPALKNLIEDLGSSEGERKNKRTFPGGASPAYMLVHLIEINHWIEDYKISW
ncbi:asparagine synthase (glutamine-hydrolyzing) [Archangium lansingense]|uniref:asparagine synthase (glutamine-hydrolyzing) n=1 Tax=Archangium lansingense TaxID=2995310 RepID=A0ABT4ACY3_9BACT|nr:asparagine synthase (glutamine-hydrolyzing) [Archangium lansinium]MCY1079436.1 asparagine synthase (glutamine-hydrolyzing) [Archangium lansinium]